eukprot:SAG31_NODE_31320_length_369_cov_1.144444_1_plen_100_part_01
MQASHQRAGIVGIDRHKHRLGLGLVLEHRTAGLQWRELGHRQARAPRGHAAGASSGGSDAVTAALFRTTKFKFSTIQTRRAAVTSRSPMYLLRGGLFTRP